MRLITFVHDGEEAIGSWIDGDSRVVHLARAAHLDGRNETGFGSMQSLIEAGPALWDKARRFTELAPANALLPTSDCRILAPLPRPAQIRDCLCFPEHLKGAVRSSVERAVAAAPDPVKARAELEPDGPYEVPASFYDFPLYYICNRMAVVGPDVDVLWPTYSQTIDYELEWAAVIGSPCSAATEQSARECIFGYTIFNDWSARDEQQKVMSQGAVNIGPGAGKDFCNSVGPCIVTADEIADPYDLAMRAFVNGVQVSEGRSSGMHFTFEDLIVSLTRAATLYPGELICSGTVGGGCSIETGQTLRSGDRIELEVEHIGKLANRVVASHIIGQ